MAVLFRLENVVYQDVLKIDELEIPGGEITGVVGPSGSGKTTFLRLLNNMISPDGGVIQFRGRPLDSYEPPALRSEVVMVPQEPVIFPGDVAENLSIGCRLSGRPEPSPQEMDRVLGRLRLGRELTGSVENLSGGEKQRLALARALLMRPPVLLLDEPSAALDEDSEEVVFQLVAEYCRQAPDRTVILVTHSQPIARRYADDLLRVERGIVVREDGAKCRSR